MITGKHIAETAENSGLLGTPYSKLDCQAFVEEVLKLAGLKIINYRGSNHMWRELVYDRSPVTKETAANIIPGVLVFKVKFDGGEAKRGYHDQMGNAYHVGINLGNGRVMHSTTGGVQYGSTKDWTDYAYIKDVEYGGEKGNEGKGSTWLKCYQIIDDIIKLLKEMEDTLYDLESGTETD